MLRKAASTAWKLLKWAIAAAVILELFSMCAVALINYFIYGHVWEGNPVNYDPYAVFLNRKGPRPTAHNSQSPDPALNRVVWCFGGSTMYNGDRDEETLPSCLARELNQRGRPRHYTVRNFGERSFNSLLEINYLQKALITSAQRPDLILFYDGANDAVAPGPLPLSPRAFRLPAAGCPHGRLPEQCPGDFQGISHHGPGQLHPAPLGKGQRGALAPGTGFARAAPVPRRSGPPLRTRPAHGRGLWGENPGDLAAPALGAGLLPVRGPGPGVRGEPGRGLWRQHQAGVPGGAPGVRPAGVFSRFQPGVLPGWHGGGPVLQTGRGPLDRSGPAGGGAEHGRGGAGRTGRPAVPGSLRRADPGRAPPLAKSVKAGLPGKL